MKYIPLSNQPNVSGTRSQSISPSLRLESDRGFPHIAWLEKGNGINKVRYSYWDGLEWNYKASPNVYISSEDIMFSPNSLVLDKNESPHIVFARKLGGGTRLSLASYSSGWNFNTFDVNYEVSWMGVTKRSGNLESSSSYSSSSSSSSSSLGDFYYVTLYDSTNSYFRVYSVGTTWTLMGSESSLPSSCIKIASCGNRIGIGFIDDDSNIQCGFFNLDSSSWVSFVKLSASITYDNIVDMDLDGYSIANTSVISCSWLSDDTSFTVCHALIDNSGTEWYESGSPVVENNSKNITSSYIVNGYRKITTCLDSGLPYIFAMGSASKLFSYSGSWVNNKIDIGGISNGIISNSLVSQYDNGVKISLSADSGDIYYFENSADSGFDLVASDIVLLTNSNAYRATYVNGELNGDDILGTNNEGCGDILRDSKKPLFISSNQ